MVFEGNSTGFTSLNLLLASHKYCVFRSAAQLGHNYNEICRVPKAKS